MVTLPGKSFFLVHRADRSIWYLEDSYVSPTRGHCYTLVCLDGRKDDCDESRFRKWLRPLWLQTGVVLEFDYTLSYVNLDWEDDVVYDTNTHHALPILAMLPEVPADTHCIITEEEV